MTIETQKRIVGEVSFERWQDAQKYEFSTWQKEPADGEDWNMWWSNKFDSYSFLADVEADIVAEVRGFSESTNVQLKIG